MFEPRAPQGPADAAMELLREVRRIEVQTSRLVSQHLAGSYQSVFKGQGIAFAEVRAYEPGDDVRAIDWNVTARTGAPHIKLFTEERELTVVILLDMSASNDFGSCTYDKRNLAARLTATAAFSAISNNDRVGMVGFSDDVELFIPPRSGRRHVLSVVRQVLTHTPAHRGTNLAAGLEVLAKLQKSHAVVFLISDFLSVPQPHEPGFARVEHALKVAKRRHDVVPIRIVDPLEMELPPLGLLASEDLEQLGSTQIVHMTSRAAKRYRERAELERTRVTELFKRLSLPLLDIRLDRDWQRELVGYFARRNRRTRQ